MKKTLYSLAILATTVLSIFNPGKSNAQISGITINSVTDTCEVSCTSSTSLWMTIDGHVAGTTSSTNNTVTVNINWGDGTDSTFTVTAQYSAGYFDVYPQHAYNVSGTFVPVVAATTYNSFTDTVTSTSSPQFDPGCGSPLSGTLYVDVNSNCVFDAGDISLPGMSIAITNTTSNPPVETFVSTDVNGLYQANLPNGYTYTIAPSGAGNTYFNPLTATCPASGTATVTTAAAAYTQDFGFACNAITSTDTMDAAVDGWGMHFMPNDNGDIYLSAGSYWWNYACGSMTGTLTLTLDPHLSYVSTYGGPDPTSVSGQTLTWDLSAFTDWYSIWLDIDVACDGTVIIGDTLCNLATITTTGFIDPVPANNSYTICKYVGDSWDPNEKSVAPNGVGPQGFIANSTPLQYFIEFQNTGNAAAVNVSIKDTINTNLNVATFNLKKSSFAGVTTSIDQDNMLQFTFNNINLPDSGADFAGSIGYVSYTILPKPNLAPGTQFTNTAYIYFDSNPAVVTNTTLNTIEFPTGVQHLAGPALKATVYPNPADDILSIKTDNKSEFTVTLTDMLGHIVAAMQSANGVKNINTHSFSPGIYFVKVIGANGGELTTKVTVQH